MALIAHSSIPGYKLGASFADNLEIDDQSSKTIISE